RCLMRSCSVPRLAACVPWSAIVSLFITTANSPRSTATVRCGRCTRTCNGLSPTTRSSAAACPSHCCRMCEPSTPITSMPSSTRRFIGKARGSKFSYVDGGQHARGHSSPATRPRSSPRIRPSPERGNPRRWVVFCSGIVAVDPETGERQHGTVTSEARRIFENLKLLLESAGSSLDRLVQVHAMIYDRIEYDVLNRLYRQYVPNAPPAPTGMSVQIEAGFKVMFDVIATAEGGRQGRLNERSSPRNIRRCRCRRRYGARTLSSCRE